MKTDETLGVESIERMRVLQRSEQLFFSIFHSNPAATILSWWADGRCVDANEAYAKLFGYTREELIGKTTVELNIWISAEERQRVVTELAQKGHLENVELTLRKKDGELINTVAAGETFTLEGQRYILSFFFDITARKRTEQQIARLSKLYVVLSRVSEMIVRVHDEEVVLSEVCRIVSQEGEFPLVWVGKVKGRRVEPVASHGSAVEYLKEIEVEVDGVLGTGPTGTSIREGRPVINDDFDINLSTSPWRDKAMRYGFRASGAFPLRREGRVIGVLSVYSPNARVFDTEQVNLLESLCADISYALDAMEQEKLRSEAEETLQHRTLELQKLTETLEMRVRKRTEELQAINEELRVENEERLKAEIELRESENRLRELSAALLNAQERERKVIAGEIHDSIGASLAAAKFRLDSALNEIGDSSPQAKAALKGVISVIQGTIEEARRIQMTLRPPMLDDLGILAAINWFCREFESTYSHIHIRWEVNIEESEVPDSLRIAIYRLLQEALNNTAKHSKADRVNLLLQKVGGAIKLEIHDNGQGFDLSEAYSRKGTAKGLGLDSMRERAELSGGSLSVESSKGSGTIIRATWPTEQVST